MVSPVVVSSEVMIANTCCNQGTLRLDIRQQTMQLAIHPMNRGFNHIQIRSKQWPIFSAVCSLSCPLSETGVGVISILPLPGTGMGKG